MKKFIITEQQKNEVMTVLLEMQAKFSFNVLAMMGSLPEIPGGEAEQGQEVKQEKALEAKK